MDIEVVYSKGYPYKAPRLIKLNTWGIDNKTIDEILSCANQQAKEIAKENTNNESEGPHEGMMFRIMQTIQDKIDNYATIQKSKEEEQLEEQKETRQDTIQYLLPDFIRKINEEKERQKQGIVLEYLRLNIELPPLDDPEELKYEKVDEPSRSRYRNEFEEVKQLSKHIYLVKNKMDYLMYSVRKVKGDIRAR